MIVIMSEQIFRKILKDGADEYFLDVGDYLFHQEEAVRSIFILTSGSINLCRKSRSGQELILSKSHATAFIAEASIYATYYHCDAVCSETATIVGVRKNHFQNLLRNHVRINELWSSFLARELQISRMRCQLLSQNTVRERLDIWLEWNEEILPPKGQWKSLALEIGVSPEALYRELSRRLKS